MRRSVVLNLYPLKQEYLAVLAELEASGGELTPEIEARIMSLDADKDLRLAALCAMVKNLKLEVEAYKTEEKRLSEARKSLERRSERLKTLAGEFLGLGESWKSGSHSISFRESQAIEVEDMEDLPNYLIRETITREPDKAAIKKAIESGEAVKGAKLVTRMIVQVK
jgi:hypothetical protein